MQRRKPSNYALLALMLPAISLAADCNFTANTVMNCNASGMFLENFNFSGKKIENVNFSGAELLGAVFNKSTLSRVNFKGANLYGAFFVESTITNANFSNADLSRADFTGAKCVSCNFEEANQTGIIFGLMGKAVPKIDVEQSNREYEQRQARIKKDLGTKEITSIPSQAVGFNNSTICNTREDLLTWLSLNGATDPVAKLRLELLNCSKRSERVSTDGRAVSIYYSSWGDIAKVTDGKNTVYAKKTEISVLAELPRSIGKPNSDSETNQKCMTIIKNQPAYFACTKNISVLKGMGPSMLNAVYAIEGRCDYLAGNDTTGLSYLCQNPSTSGCVGLKASQDTINACSNCGGSNLWLRVYAADRTVLRCY